MTDKSIGKLREMAKRGRMYREVKEIDLFGETVEYEVRPLVDDEFLPLSAHMADHLGVEDEDIKGGDTVDEALDEIDDARDEEDADIDVGKLDDEFVGIIQKAAALGLTADFAEDGSKRELSQEDAEEFIGGLVGGYSLEIGYEVLDLAGNIRDAEKFRGGRGSL